MRCIVSKDCSCPPRARPEGLGCYVVPDSTKMMGALSLMGVLYVGAFCRPGICTTGRLWALIERPYSREPLTVGAVYDRPRFVVQSRRPIRITWMHLTPREVDKLMIFTAGEVARK